MTIDKELVSLDSINNILKSGEFDKDQSHKISNEVLSLINWMEEHWQRVVDNMDDSPIAFEDPDPIEIKPLDGLTNFDLLKIKNEVVKLFKNIYPDEIVIETMITILKCVVEMLRYRRVLNWNIAYLLDSQNDISHSLEGGSDKEPRIYEKSDDDYEPFLDDDEFYENLLKEQESLSSTYEGTGKTIKVNVVKKHSSKK